MVDMSAIAAAVGSLKAAKDIAEAMIGLRDAAAFQEKLIEFQSKIIDANNAAFAAQEERLALMAEIQTLRAQVDRLEAWRTLEERYRLVRHEPGVVVYALKPDRLENEPPHFACPACFGKQIRSILQASEPSSGLTRLNCKHCGANYSIRAAQGAADGGQCGQVAIDLPGLRSDVD